MISLIFNAWNGLVRPISRPTSMILACRNHPIETDDFSPLNMALPTDNPSIGTSSHTILGI